MEKWNLGNYFYFERNPYSKSHYSFENILVVYQNIFNVTGVYFDQGRIQNPFLRISGGSSTSLYPPLILIITRRWGPIQEEEGGGGCARTPSPFPSHIIDKHIFFNLLVSLIKRFLHFGSRSEMSSPKVPPPPPQMNVWMHPR